MSIVHRSIKHLFIGLAAVYFIYTSLTFFTQYPIVSFFYKLHQIIAFLVILLAALLSGYKALRLMKLSIRTALEKYIYSFGIGLGILSMMVFICGVFHLLNPLVLIFLIVAILIICRREGVDLYKTIDSCTIPRLNLIQASAAVIIIISMMLSLLAAFAPPNYYDSLVYHLALPAYYLRTGCIRPVSFNLFSYFPAHMEMLFTLSLAIGGEVTANLVSWFTLVITMACFMSFLRPLLNKNYLLLSLLLLVTSPSILLLSSGTYVDMGLTMYTLLCISTFYVWWKEGAKTYLLLSAIFGGFAFSTKYTGAVCPALLGIMMLVRGGVKQQLRETVKDAMKYAGIVIGLSLPWLIKNMITVGNPVFPFLYKFFGWGDIVWTKAIAAGYFSNFVEYGIKKNVLLDIMNLFMSHEKPLTAFGGGFDILGNFGWTLPFIVFPALIVAVRKKKHVLFFTVYTAMYLLIWAFTGQVLRLLLPIFPVIVLLGCSGLEQLMHRAHIWVKGLCIIGAGIFIVSNFYLFFTIESIIQPWHVAMGIEGRDDYLRRKYPDYYPAMEFINNNLEDSSKIYLYGDQRGYYCRKNYEISSPFAPERMVSWANTANNADDFIKLLSAHGFTHLYYNKVGAERLKPYGVMNFSRKGSKNWKDSITNYFTVLYEDRFSVVYRIPLVSSTY